ncbi:MAG: TAXI family TRAP transporter solute-binding subunit [Kibdelosporangium sp.]
MTVPRKLVVLGAVLLALTGCTSGIEQLNLAIATGGPTGVYNELGNGLADAWASQTGMARPKVLETEGSPDNLRRLASGEADIAFSAADVAIDTHGKFSALARIYDDYLHIVVRAESPIQTIDGLAGKRISVGATNSGVKKIAERVLGVAGVTGQQTDLDLRRSAQALVDGQIDAFFWSGGLPTNEIRQLARGTGIRLLDLREMLPAIRSAYGYYSAAAIPLSVYDLRNTTPVTTLVVPNLLLVTDRLSAGAAKVLTQGIFAAQQNLAKLTTAAYSIEPRSAIETLPIQLHQGAQEYYREDKP